jgi:Tol biopolymer transport system component
MNYPRSISHILFFALLLLLACKEHDNPVSSGGFPVEAGPILFISDKSGTYQLYSMNEDGSSVQQLTSDSSFPIFDAKWSPDGKKIAVVSLIGDEGTYPEFRNAIFVMDADGKNRYQLTQQWFYLADSTYGTLQYGGAISPVWSPDSKQIAYSRLMVPEAIANMDIFIIDIDGTNERRITSTINSFESVLDWGGNSSTILASVMVNSSPVTKILMYTSDGIILRSWADNSLGYRSMVYSSRGDRVAFVVDFYPASVHQDSIFVTNLNEDLSVNITKGEARFYRVVTWSPDDVVILVSVTNKIFLLNSEGGGVKDITPFAIGNIFPTSWRR